LKTTLSPQPALIHLCGLAGLAGVLVFAGTSTALQFVRTDYFWLKTPLSFYLMGPEHGWLHAGFYSLAAAIVLIAAGLYLNAPAGARSSATVLMFSLGAVGVVLAAVSRTDVNSHLTLHGALHLIGAAVAFLFTSTAMLLQSWYFRRDGRWRAAFRGAMTLAVVEYLWLWFYALKHTPVNGLVQKTVILLILAWLAAAAWRLAFLPARRPA
jgi:hypothetical protein